MKPIRRLAPSIIKKRAHQHFRKDPSQWIYLYLPYFILEVLPFILTTIITVQMGRQSVELWMNSQSIGSIFSLVGQWATLNLTTLLLQILRVVYGYYLGARVITYLNQGGEESTTQLFTKKIPLLGFDLIVLLIMGVIPLLGGVFQLVYKYLTLGYRFSYLDTEKKAVDQYVEGIKRGVHLAVPLARLYFVEYLYDWLVWLITFRISDAYFGPHRILALGIYFNQEDQARELMRINGEEMVG